MNIDVSNLSKEVTTDELKIIFSAYGKIEIATILTDEANNLSKGLGFVQMINAEEAKSAITDLNGKLVSVKIISVFQALSKQECKTNSKSISIKTGTEVSLK